MATAKAAKLDSTTFIRNLTLSTSLVSLGGEVTYWPGLRDVENAPEPFDNVASGYTTEHREATPAREVTPLIRLSGEGPPARRFQVLQQWEGLVTRISGDWFEADLRDLMNASNPMEVAEFPFAAISPDDKPLISPGCVFYWVIGYETRSGGQITHSSEIRVRRAPLWTQRKLEALKASARELFTLEGEDGEEADRTE